MPYKTLESLIRPLPSKGLSRAFDVEGQIGWIFQTASSETHGKYILQPLLDLGL